MKNVCCPYCDEGTTPGNGGCHAHIRPAGSFRRKFDGRRIQRYVCRKCGRTFSSSTFKPTYRQHKPFLNNPIYLDLNSGVSQRRIALRYGITRKTIARKLVFLAGQARLRHKNYLSGLSKIQHLNFDDMESSIHTKLKPVSIPLVVDAKSRRILAFDVVSMPAKGRLAALSRKKYGRRPDHRRDGWKNVLTAVSPHVAKDALIMSDSHPCYPEMIARYLPGLRHERVLSRRGCVVGQGELKSCAFDPIFSFNHSAAMLRANINRLFRRTWCTSKELDRLKDHIAIYIDFHNFFLLQNPSSSY